MKTISTVVVLFCISFTPIKMRSQSQPTELALRHVNVIDATGAPVQHDMTVIVSGSQITDLQQTGNIRLPKHAKSLTVKTSI